MAIRFVANATFICWHCQIAYRAKVLSSDAVRRCAKCRREITWVSPKVEIPKKNDKRAWRILREDLLRRKDKQIEDERKQKRYLMNYYQKEIARLKAITENDGRKKAIRLLEKKLAKLQSPRV